MMVKYLAAFVVFCVILSACVSEKIEIEPPVTNNKDTTTTDTTTTDTTTTDTTTVTDTCKFSSVINPIIQANCAVNSCHVSGAAQGDFTSYSGVKAKVDNGKLVQRALVAKDMPPSGPLSQSDRDKIQCWIDNGAPNN